MGSVVIISKASFVCKDESGVTYLARCSRLIRGEQVVERLGAKLNPGTIAEDDTVIYIKPRNLRRWRVRDGDWVDVMDAQYDIIDQLKDRPKVNVIAYSDRSYNYLRTVLNNKIVLIPEHHCNFERLTRERKDISVAGMIGHPTKEAIETYIEIKDNLKKIGMDCIICNDYLCREDVVDFYLNIDVQLIPCFALEKNSPYAHPNRIVNAASFGVPTISAPMEGYKEFEFISANDMDEMMEALRELPNHYDETSERIRQAAEAYHIDNNLDRYRNLA